MTGAPKKAKRTPKLKRDPALIEEQREWWKLFGAWFKRTRESRWPSQKDLAEQLGIRRQAIIEVEAGKRRMSLYELMRACELMNISPRFSGDLRLIVPPADISNSMVRLDLLPPKQKQEVMSLIDSHFKQFLLDKKADHLTSTSFGVSLEPLPYPPTVRKRSDRTE